MEQNRCNINDCTQLPFRIEKKTFHYLNFLDQEFSCSKQYHYLNISKLFAFYINYNFMFWLLLLYFNWKKEKKYVTRKAIIFHFNRYLIEKNNFVLYDNMMMMTFWHLFFLTPEISNSTTHWMNVISYVRQSHQFMIVECYKWSLILKFYTNAQWSWKQRRKKLIIKWSMVLRATFTKQISIPINILINNEFFKQSVDFTINDLLLKYIECAQWCNSSITLIYYYSLVGK